MKHQREYLQELAEILAKAEAVNHEIMDLIEDKAPQLADTYTERVMRPMREAQLAVERILAGNKGLH